MPVGGSVSTTLVRASAFASLARGIAGLVMPRRFARRAGVHPDATRTRLLLGLREVVIGSALRVTRRPRRWLAIRLAGDGVDVGLHSIELGDRAVRSRRTMLSWAVVLIAFVVDAWLLARV